MTDRSPAASSVARLDHVGLSVRDLASAESWYRRAFGFTVELRLRVEPIDLDIVMLLTSGGGRIELLHRDLTRLAPPPVDPAQAAATTGYGHLALDVEGIDQVYDRLLTLGARPVVSPRPSPEPSVRMAFVADPEGNLIELLDRTAGTAEPSTETTEAHR